MSIVIMNVSDIAQCAIDHYHQTLPSNNGSKPQLGREWTVYAAIVACRRRRVASHDDDEMTNEGDEMWVVSCATGSKCTSLRKIVSSLPRPNTLDVDDESICKCYNGMVLKDSHAEALTRRGLMSVLWDEIEHSLQCHKRTTRTTTSTADDESKDGYQTRQLLEVYKLQPPSFRIMSDISLHMYVSDSPCGDASIYEIRKDTDTADGETELNFTGAKIIVSSGIEGCNNIDDRNNNGSITSILTCSSNGDQSVNLGREGTQQLGALRIKSSRSNMSPELRSTSMSCSDKLLRWGVFGLQGSLLSMYIPEPICLSSICVSRDPRSVHTPRGYDGQLAALKRALLERMKNVTASTTLTACCNEHLKPPEVAVVDIKYESSKSSSDERQTSFMKKRTTDSTSPIPSKRRRLVDSSVGGENEAQKLSPTGLSINWHQNRVTKERIEITVGATGLKRGKKAKAPKDVLDSASRLCRFSFLRRFIKCTNIQDASALSLNSDKETLTKSDRTGDTASPCSYVQYKKEKGCYIGNDCFQGSLCGYIRSGNGDDFVIPHNHVTGQEQ